MSRLDLDACCPHGDPRPERCALCRAEARRLAADHPTHDVARAAAGDRPDREDD